MRVRAVVLQKRDWRLRIRRWLWALLLLNIFFDISIFWLSNIWSLVIDIGACPENQVWGTESICPPTCDNPYVSCKSFALRNGCKCAPGYIWLNDDKEECVLEDRCECETNNVIWKDIQIELKSKPKTFDRWNAVMPTTLFIWEHRYFIAKRRNSGYNIEYSLKLVLMRIKCGEQMIEVNGFLFRSVEFGHNFFQTFFLFLKTGVDKQTCSIVHVSLDDRACVLGWFFRGAEAGWTHTYACCCYRNYALRFTYTDVVLQSQYRRPSWTIFGKQLKQMPVFV